MPTPHRPSLAARRALRTLGADIRLARKNRGLTADLLAERAFTTRQTLRRIEAGDNSVSIGIYAAVLHSLGLIDNFANAASPDTDTVGKALAEARLPKRIRTRRPPEQRDA